MKRSITVSLALCLSVMVPVNFGQHHAHDAQKKQTPNDVVTAGVKKPGRIELPLVSFEIPDSLLVDQNGKQLKFYSDLVKGKVVVVHFFFTTCSAVCPMQGRSLVRLRNRLGDRLGRDVFFISISKDPKNDTPESLSRWAKRYSVGSGWTLLTGEPPVIKKLLWNFAGEEIGQAMHEPMIIVGNDRTGTWTTTDGLLSSDELVKVIDEISRS